ncbi:hypothetical protein GOP47_0019773 [Adiantum capillus-veneris]|uniref:Uncharacterized protein n=1 Tax=Adiantum capillus-veneris TaxID=13818 RepID=A0A9D4Z7D1_ADICA|nr:hypothetical protein GOP47_0019773 [Adiantum capillus-veneris]
MLTISVLIGTGAGEGLHLEWPLILVKRVEHQYVLATEPLTISKANVVEPAPPLDGGPPALGAPPAGVAGGIATEHKVGIMHDQLCVTFGCSEHSSGSVLLEHEAINLGILDASKKEAATRQSGWKGGVALSAHGVGSVCNSSQSSAVEHILSFKAIHIPPVECSSSLDDVGLGVFPTNYFTSDVALSAQLKCRDVFLLRESRLKKHQFQMHEAKGISAEEGLKEYNVGI